MPDACPKCKSRGKCYRDPDFAQGGYELKCFACGYIVAWIRDDGDDGTEQPGPPELRVRPLLSTREYVTAELGPEMVPLVEELGLSTYDP